MAGDGASVSADSDGVSALPTLCSLPAELQLAILGFCDLKSRWSLRACAAYLREQTNVLWLGANVLHGAGGLPPELCVDNLLAVIASVRALGDIHPDDAFSFFLQHRMMLTPRISGMLVGTVVHHDVPCGAHGLGLYRTALELAVHVAMIQARTPEEAVARVLAACSPSSHFQQKRWRIGDEMRQLDWVGLTTEVRPLPFDRLIAIYLPTACHLIAVGCDCHCAQVLYSDGTSLYHNGEVRTASDCIDTQFFAYGRGRRRTAEQAARMAMVAAHLGGHQFEGWPDPCGQARAHYDPPSYHLLSECIAYDLDNLRFRLLSLLGHSCLRACISLHVWLAAPVRFRDAAELEAAATEGVAYRGPLLARFWIRRLGRAQAASLFVGGKQEAACDALLDSMHLEEAEPARAAQHDWEDAEAGRGADISRRFFDVFASWLGALFVDSGGDLARVWQNGLRRDLDEVRELHERLEHAPSARASDEDGVSQAHVGHWV